MKMVNSRLKGLIKMDQLFLYVLTIITFLSNSVRSNVGESRKSHLFCLCSKET